MLDFARRGCDLRYTIGFEYNEGTGTGETNGELERIIKYSVVMHQ